MGMFDTFSGFKDKCPGGCGQEFIDYQTKMFVCELRVFKIGDEIKLEYHDGDYFELSKGKFTAYDYCDKCKKMVFADIVIENGRVDHSENLRFRGDQNDLELSNS